MNLRDQLKEILPEILPARPADAIKGTELIRLVKYRLQQEYSDATLRYHFSILCCDPSAPIAKVDQGQGYYQRQNRLRLLDDARSLTAAGMTGRDLFQNGRDAVDLARARSSKLRAIFSRLARTEGRFPYPFPPAESPEDLWKYPDFAVVDWEADESPDSAAALNRQVLEMKARLGVDPFRISSVRLVGFVTCDTVREIFFQTLSGSRWAHAGELVVATPVTDEQLAEDLRLLGAEFGIGVSTLGLLIDALDDVADSAAITRLDDRAFEALQSRLLTRQKIAIPAGRRVLDWPSINHMRMDNPEFQQFLSWLDRSLRDGGPLLTPRDPLEMPLSGPD